MFVCKACLAERYEHPTWEHAYSRSVGPCEVCHKVDVCVDQHHSAFTSKDIQTEWKCAAANQAFGLDCCHCSIIKVGHEVIAIERDVLGGIRCIVTFPNPKAHSPEYTRSFRCMAALVKL